MHTALCSDPEPSNYVGQLPDWLPNSTRAYLDHICTGKSIRAIARELGCHASTVMRQIRKIEALRDCPLKDEALDQISARLAARTAPTKSTTELPEMPVDAARKSFVSDDVVEREARRILRRLCESNAFMLVSPEMEKAAVFRESVPGRRTRTAVVDRDVARVFAIKDWIQGQKRDRLAIYHVTSAGRAALKRMLADDQKSKRRAGPYAEVEDTFQTQHREFGERHVMEEDGIRKIRYNLAESPLTSLARKRDKNGRPYLSADQLDAGERLREDFELAQLGPSVTQNWDKFLTASTHGGHAYGEGPGHGPSAARDRVASAMAALGPGLADIAFRCCCFLEGLETAEKRLGWSARSGKIVLSIALQRLADHYGTTSETRMVG